MSTPRISVALCTYNGARFLKEQLESISQQTRLPDEVVACDDGSQDDTLEILRKFQKSAPFLVQIVVNERNLGFTKNFERAIQLCSGEMIALSDQDDIWYPNKLEVLSQVLGDDENAGCVVSDANLIEGNGEVLSSTRWRQSIVRFLPGTLQPFPIKLQTLIKENVACGSAMMMRSSLKPFVLPVSNLWAHDYWIAMIATLIGKYGLGVKEPLMKYRLHATQAFGLKPPPRKLLQYVRSSPRDIWAKDAAMYRDMRTTIHDRPELLSKCKQDDLQYLDQKIEHLIQRDLARSSAGLSRLKIVITELVKGRYNRLSSSWKSAVRDLVV